jgi:hypothetical protein
LQRAKQNRQMIKQRDARQKVICGSAIEGDWISGDRFARKTVQTREPRASILAKTWLAGGVSGRFHRWILVFSTIFRFGPTGSSFQRHAFASMDDYRRSCLDSTSSLCLLEPNLSYFYARLSSTSYTLSSDAPLDDMRDRPNFSSDSHRHRAPPAPQKRSDCTINRGRPSPTATPTPPSSSPPPRSSIG